MDFGKGLMVFFTLTITQAFAYNLKSFTSDAKNTVKKASKNIVLIDGAQLTQLMIKYGVGCKTKETVFIQKIDEDFFEEM